MGIDGLFRALLDSDSEIGGRSSLFLSSMWWSTDAGELVKLAPRFCDYQKESNQNMEK